MGKKIIIGSILLVISVLLYGQNQSGGELPDNLLYSGNDLERFNHKAQCDTLKTFPLYYKYDVASIATDKEHFYTTTWDTNWFFKHDMEGVILKAFQMEGVKHVRDMTYSNVTGYFYGSNADHDAPCEIFEMNFYKETLVRVIPVTCEGIDHVRHITYDATLDDGKGGFWIGDWSSLGAVDMQGSQLVGASEITGSFADCYGTAYDRTTDFFNPKLWLSCNLYPENNEPPVQILRAFDIKTLTLSDTVYQIDGSGFPLWLPTQMLSGGICSYTENGYLYLAHVFQTLRYNDWNFTVVFQLAKEGIAENEKDSYHPQIIPNPVTDKCVIDLQGFKATKVKIYDAIGKLVLTQEVLKNTDSDKIGIDVSNLNAGVYHVSLNSGMERYSLRMLIE